MKTSFLPYLLWMLLAACSLVHPPQPAPTLAPPPVTAPKPPEPSACDSMLAYYQRLMLLPPADTANEATALASQPDIPQTIFKKALILSLSRDPGELTKARALLEKVLNSPETDSQALKPLAELLAAEWAERLQLSEQAARLAQQLKDAQRHADQLGDMLERLKAIELTLPTQPSRSSSTTK